MFTEKFGKLEERESKKEKEYSTNIPEVTSMGTTGLS